MLTDRLSGIRATNRKTDVRVVIRIIMRMAAPVCLSPADASKGRPFLSIVSSDGGSVVYSDVRHEIKLSRPSEDRR